MTYSVRLEQFEGPLELLLHLIEKEKLDITRLSLSRVADQYLEYVAAEQAIPLSHLATFLSIASRLLLLKSRALLPLLTFTEEEEEQIADLEWQLREYRRFRDAAEDMRRLWGRGMSSYPRESLMNLVPVFYPPENLSPNEVQAAFVSVLGEIPVYEKLEEEEIAEIVTLEEKILDLQRTLSDRMETSFHEITHSIETKVEMIVSFLALLELVKQRFVEVDQQEFFGDIAIRRKKMNVRP